MSKKYNKPYIKISEFSSDEIMTASEYGANTVKDLLTGDGENTIIKLDGKSKIDEQNIISFKW